MKQMTKFTLTSMAAGIALAALSSGAMAQEKWTMTTTWPENLDLIQIDKHWAELVNQLAGDEIQIEFYAGGTLMPGTEVFDATETGSIQAAGDWPGYWAGRSPAFSPLAATPSLFNGMDYLNWITQWGGFELYQEIYGQYNLVYLPYGITNNESGFRGGTPIASLADIEGKRLRLSGRDQGRVLEQLGGSQVTLAGGEIYQAIERGVVDGAEFSTPGVDYKAGFSEVADYWMTPGWHQSASVFGVMINKDAWDALSEETQEKLKIASEATMAWSLAWSEKQSTEGTAKFLEDGTTINQLSEEDLAQIQEVTNQVIVQGSCEDPMLGKVYQSMISYMQDYAQWRDVSVPYNMSRVTDNLPSLDEIEACLE
ncbi:MULTISPECIES: TRAP transporter substrate-binding protein DctP [unclassified Halomonas]|uniref:TRAP transporter substrate-binding protein DctP n=1 Tax=Halomonas sp. H10-59 TaxID=2950874 RepID=A0AAU7KWP9_9GAMM|nr:MULTISPECIES: TRAP transporter substrate-binding protein DctP [unclassified Halomonas]MBR9769831.1 ABC transporter substrate-binding protein [Gammaproteobacteria bacterium]MBS8270147.1 ABC transporter substrate-binding protein [Halomonas litopenaei]KJZ17488.1 ABC transporter substrate-binding protein [Halomonas sp. S2151]MAR72684.1 ABC transporter substrate-binding protein [Halomonas sp.]MBR9878169.1 ABC transporter substrate-binding protein [Gammaproteobacteria bacterium]|tara:strand:- start:535 stop:1641 length:1107 start_codon:yes stop_codon:yes gene_type:complete